MGAGSSTGSVSSVGQPNRVRQDLAGSSPGGSQGGAGDLDDIDRHIVRELARDARIAKNALAERVGIRGYHADVDPAALGRPLQAMIAVRLQSHARNQIRGFAAAVAGLPEVI